MVYLIMSSDYEDRQAHGYFTDKCDAEKLCAMMNESGKRFKGDYCRGSYYVYPIEDFKILYPDVSDIKLKFQYCVEYNAGLHGKYRRMAVMRGDYIDKRPPEHIYIDFNYKRLSPDMIRYYINCESRQEAHTTARSRHRKLLKLIKNSEDFEAAKKRWNFSHGKDHGMIESY